MKNLFQNLPVLLVGILVLSFCARIINRIDAPNPYEDVNYAVPRFELEPIPGEGQVITYEDLTDGTVSMVTVFASWCGPCQQEHPLLKRIYDQSEVYMYGIAVNEPPQNSANFLSRHGTPFDMVGSDPKGTIISKAFNINNIPQTLLIDSKGHVRFVFRGGLTHRAWLTLLLPRIRKYEKEKQPLSDENGSDYETETENENYSSNSEDYYNDGSDHDENYY